jgi:peptidoglycan/xylan/chitin deacetylase (PgdA/CDA1 family)
LIKQSLLNLMRVSGAFELMRLISRRRALILTYHRFSEREDGVRVSARAFDEQVEYLAAHYTIVPLSQLAGYLLRGREIPPRMAAITIDDGYRDAYEIAFPILRKHCATATVFVVTDFVEGNSWLWTDKPRYLTTFADPQKIEVTIEGCKLNLELNGEATRQAAADRINAALKSLSEEARDAALDRLAHDLGVNPPERPPEEYSAINWRQAREMDIAGVEIGSHTLTHPILTSLGDDRLREEVRQSRTVLQTVLGRNVETFCYPNGDHDLRVRRAVAHAGYQCAVTTEVGLNDMRNNPLALRRIHGEYDLLRFVQSTCGFEEVKNRWRHQRAHHSDGTGNIDGKRVDNTCEAFAASEAKAQ